MPSDTTRMPHASVDVSKIPDYVDPFVAYRVWRWHTDNGVISVGSGTIWKPKVTFEACCIHQVRKYIEPYLIKYFSNLAPDFISKKDLAELRRVHPVPNETCTCGVYAGINMQHLINIGYIGHGIHGEVYLWGRVYRHELGWRAQYAYPKTFIVPSDMLPFAVQEIQKRMESLIAFDVDILLQKDKQASVDGEKIPLWVKEYGYSQQGISYLINRAQRQAENIKIKGLRVGDRVSIVGDHGGIAIVQHIEGDQFYHKLGNFTFRKKISDAKWSIYNWRWETVGHGMMTSSVGS